jgi:hypothetical protein
VPVAWIACPPKAVPACRHCSSRRLRG